MPKCGNASVRRSVARSSVPVSFPDDNLSKHQRIFTKLGMRIDIVEILFGIANGRISSNFDSYLPETYFRFRMITRVNVSGFSPNLVQALILWRSGLGLLMSKFRQLLMELSARDIFSFPDDSLSKPQGILPKLGTCIDIKENWFRIANGQISSIFDSYLSATSKWQGIIGLRFYFSFWSYPHERASISKTCAGDMLQYLSTYDPEGTQR